MIPDKEIVIGGGFEHFTRTFSSKIGFVIDLASNQDTRIVLHALDTTQEYITRMLLLEIQIYFYTFILEQ